MNHASLDLFQRNVALIDDRSIVDMYDNLSQEDKVKIGRILANNNYGIAAHNHQLLIGRM